MKILNLDCGIGGNRKKWGDEHQITAIEIDEKIAAVYQENFPNDIVIVTDSKEYLKNNYNNGWGLIWSSRPCQKHSIMMKATRHDVADYIDISLYQFIIFLQHFFKGKWVVENVVPYYKPLITPTARIGRHLFWSNFYIKSFDTENISGFINKGTVEESEDMKKWLGIHYEGNLYYKGNHCPGQVLRNAVDPKIGKYILEQSLKEEIQTKLF